MHKETLSAAFIWDLFLPLLSGGIREIESPFFWTTLGKTGDLTGFNQTLRTPDLEDFANFPEIFVSKSTSPKSSVFTKKVRFCVCVREFGNLQSLLFQNS